MPIFRTPADRLNDVDALMQKHLRGPTLEKLRREHDAAIEAYNKRLTETKAALATRNEGLAAQSQALEARRRDLDTLDRELEAARKAATTDEAILQFNQRVAERNRAVSQHGAAVQAYNQAHSAYSAEVEAFNARMRQESTGLDVAIAGLNTAVQERNRWLSCKGPSRLSSDLDSAFVALVRSCAHHPDRTADQAALTRARALRRELAEHTRARMRQDPHGLVLVDAALGEHEPITLLVDTGASSCTVSPAMIEALGWQQHVGETVQLNLAAGIKVKAPALVIPKLSVHGHVAKFIKGLVLPEDTPGVDGILGQSFLCAFDVSISHREGYPALVLEPRAVAAVGEPAFDVFICHKSADQAVGRQLFELLTARGLRPFFSPVSVPQSGEAAYQIAIQRALLSSTHMVVLVSTEGGKLFSKWVEAEWQGFANELLSGRKQGNIVNLLCNGLAADKLPFPLSNYHALVHGAPSWDLQLLQFLAPNRPRA